MSLAVCALKFISGKYQGYEIPVPARAEYVVGRSVQADIVLMEEMVSRKHAVLAAQGGELTITDLGSTNGTFVNGTKVKTAPLHIHDRLLIGTSILRVIPIHDANTAARILAIPELRQQMQEFATRSATTSAMAGELEDVPLPDLLQLFSVNRKSGILRVRAQRTGEVVLKDGALRDARISGTEHLSPMKAVCRMMCWDHGSFEFSPLVGDAPLPQNFADSTEGVLLEAMRQKDELQHAGGDVPDENTRVRLCLPLAPRLTALSAKELEILQTAINFERTGDILDESPLTDLEVMTALGRLVRQGYLEAE